MLALLLPFQRRNPGFKVVAAVPQPIEGDIKPPHGCVQVGDALRQQRQRGGLLGIST